MSNFELITILAVFSFIAFWKESVVVFMLAGGASMAIGLYWFDSYVSNIGLAIALMLICYSLACFGFAFKCMFTRKFKIAGNED